MTKLFVEKKKKNRKSLGSMARHRVFINFIAKAHTIKWTW